MTLDATVAWQRARTGWAYVPTRHEGRYDLLHDHAFAGFVALEPEHDQALTMQSIVAGLNDPPLVAERDIGPVTAAKLLGRSARELLELHPGTRIRLPDEAQT